MTVSNIDPVVQFVYSGPGDYAFLFPVAKDSDVTVNYTSLTGVTNTLVYGTDYTITTTVGIDGGVCVLSYAATSGLLEIRRDVKYTQEVDWVNNDPLDMEILEAAVDKNVMLIQQLKSDINDATITTDWRGDWVTGTSYNRRDMVISATNNNMYICLTAHIAGAFNTDLSSGYWRLVFDVASLSTVPVAGYVTNEAALGTGSQDGEFVVCTSNGNIYIWESSLAKWRMRSGNIYANETDTLPFAKETGSIASIGAYVNMYDGANWSVVSDLAVNFKFNLEVKTNNANALNVKCSEIILTKGAANASVIVRNFDHDVDITVSGLGGLDAGVEANSTLYYIWVISNGVTESVVLSTSDTSPTVPAGYDYIRIVGEVYNDPAGDFVQFRRIDDEVYFTSVQNIYASQTLTLSKVEFAYPAVVPSGTTKVKLVASTSGPVGNTQLITPENSNGFQKSVGIAYLANSYAGDVGYVPIYFELISLGLSSCWAEAKHTTLAANQRLDVYGYTKGV